MRSRALPALTLSLAALALVAALTPAAATPAAAPLKLSFKLVMFEGAAPSFYPLGDEEGKGMGHVVAHFRRLPDARPEGKAAAVRKLLLSVSRQGNGARVSVFAHGEGGAWTDEERVADYFVGEGEEHLVSELTAYGIEPLKVGVVRRADPGVGPPAVSNRTASVEVVSVEVDGAAPSYELTLRNASAKRLRAVEVRMLRGEQPGGGKSRHFSDADPAADPGGSWKTTLDFGWNFKTDGALHVMEPPNRLVVDSVLFADGSYEGDVVFAARAAAGVFGRRAQLARSLRLLEGWREPAGADARGAHADLTARVRALATAADDALMAEFSSRYPGLSAVETAEVRAAAGEGMRGLRDLILFDLEDTGKKLSSETDLGPLREWVRLRTDAARRLLAPRRAPGTGYERTRP